MKHLNGRTKQEMSSKVGLCHSRECMSEDWKEVASRDGVVCTLITHSQ